MAVETDVNIEKTKLTEAVMSSMSVEIIPKFRAFWVKDDEYIECVLVRNTRLTPA